MRYKLKAHAKDLLRQILKDNAYDEILKDSFGNLSIVSSVERLTPDSDLKVKRVNVNDVLYAFKD